jgi:hypothetical protein
MSRIKSLLKIQKVRVTLALVAISFAVVVSFFLPKESDPNIGLVNNPSTPTVGLTSPVGTLMLNHTVIFHDVHFTVLKAEEAGAFSDDRKYAGTYTVRIYVHTVPDNKVQAAEGIDYASLVRLILPDGQTVSPKLVSLLPVILPHQPGDGFFDFPLMGKLPLASLSLRLGNDTMVAFSS